MIIGISLNEVLRAFIPQFGYVHDKYYGPINFNEQPVTDFNLLNHPQVKLKTKDELNSFLYSEASLEIFGHADQMYENIMTHFNMFLLDVEDEEKHNIEIVSREVHKSIPATLFFLSKLSCRAPKISFVKQYIDKWNNIDVLITANPIALENKPSGKVSIKVKAPYNTNSPSDFEIDSLIDFMKNEELRNKILNTKITSYEEI